MPQELTTGGCAANGQTSYVSFILKASCSILLQRCVIFVSSVERYGHSQNSAAVVEDLCSQSSIGARTNSADLLLICQFVDRGVF